MVLCENPATLHIPYTRINCRNSLSSHLYMIVVTAPVRARPLMQISVFVAGSGVGSGG